MSASTGESGVIFRGAKGLGERGEIRRFQQALQARVAEGRPFQCMIADDAELRRLNLRFLGKDYPTDVLSFPAGQANGFLGEIAISVERARSQAEEFGHSLEDEIGILMLHGLLHLMGMDHEKDRGQMRRVETRWRSALGLPAGLIERVTR